MLSPAFGGRLGQNGAQTFPELAIQTRPVGNRSVIGGDSLCRAAKGRLRRDGRQGCIHDLVASEQSATVRWDRTCAGCLALRSAHGHWFGLVAFGEQEPAWGIEGRAPLQPEQWRFVERFAYFRTCYG